MTVSGFEHEQINYTDHDTKCRLLGGTCHCVSVWCCEKYDPLAEEENNAMRDRERERLLSQLTAPLYARIERLIEKQDVQIRLNAAGRIHRWIIWTPDGLRQRDILEEAIEACRELVHSLYP